MNFGLRSGSLELITAIKKGFLTAKAAGAWGGSIDIPPAETPPEETKFFEFDMDNDYIAGFNIGAWGEIL